MPRHLLWHLSRLMAATLIAAVAMEARPSTPQTQKPPNVLAQMTRVPAGGMTWDFETGNLAGWQPAGIAFANQPTFGDNTSARNGGAANQQGQYWIGTFENYQGPGRGRPGGVQGDRPQGTLTSNDFTIPASLTFRIGGGSTFATRVELIAFEQIEGESRLMSASGKDSETMQDTTWDLSKWAGRQGRIRIVDASSDRWGHINVDDFRFGRPARGRDVLVNPNVGRAKVLQPPVKMVPVPDLFGAGESQARDLLVNAGLKVGEVTRVEANARPGTVFKQDQGAGTPVPVGTAVGFVLALPMPGSGRGGRGTVVQPPVKMVPVPDLLGETEGKARDLLTNAGLRVGEVTKAEVDAKPSTVFKQSHAAGSQVAADTAVSFAIAVPITVEVPSVVGNTQGGAVTVLRNGRLRPGTIKEEQSRLPRGQVLTQGTPAGTRVPVGSPVDLTIAVPITLPVPPLRLLPRSDAIALLKKHELTVGDITTGESREPPGSVVSQRPAAGTVVEIGSPVSFVVATPVTVDVPPLVNRSQADAVALLKKLELTVGSVTSEESRKAPDTVLSQVPVAGTRVTIGTAVGFVTARPVTVLVPDVVSRLEAEARSALVAAELAIGSTGTEEARVPPGSVLRQSVAAGTRVTIGTAIDLVTATPVTVRVPKIAGLKEEAARAALVALELKPGGRYQESPVEPGTVLTQSIDPDTQVPIDTLVDFVVSSVETVPMPSVVGITSEEARQRLVAGRLSVGSEALRPVRSESRGVVLAQSVEAGTRIPVGTAIVLTVSTPELVVVPGVVDLSRDDAFTRITSTGLKVGRVARRLSLSAGGTIVAQELRPGVRVEFGTSVAVDEALPRYIWMAPAAAVFAAVAGVVGLKRRRAKEMLATAPSATHPPVPPLMISVKPNIHMGEADVHRDAARAIRLEVRLIPIAGSADQVITPASGSIIKSERRVPIVDAANEEGTS